MFMPDPAVIFPVVYDTWGLCNQIDNMKFDNMSRGLYLEDVTGPVRLCQATSCGGLADIHPWCLVISVP